MGLLNIGQATTARYQPSCSSEPSSTLAAFSFEDSLYETEERFQEAGYTPWQFNYQDTNLTIHNSGECDLKRQDIDLSVSGEAAAFLTATQSPRSACSQQEVLSSDLFTPNSQATGVSYPSDPRFPAFPSDYGETHPPTPKEQAKPDPCCEAPWIASSQTSQQPGQLGQSCSPFKSHHGQVDHWGSGQSFRQVIQDPSLESPFSTSTNRDIAAEAIAPSSSNWMDDLGFPVLSGGDDFRPVSQWAAEYCAQPGMAATDHLPEHVPLTNSQDDIPAPEPLTPKPRERLGLRWPELLHIEHFELEEVPEQPRNCRKGGKAKRAPKAAVSEDFSDYQPRERKKTAFTARGRKVNRLQLSEEDNCEDYAETGNRRSKHHNPWTVEETEALVLGVERCGGGKWADIKKLGFRAIEKRSAVDLKDKWRNLQAALHRTKSDKKREIPDSLLKRVKELVPFTATKARGEGRANPARKLARQAQRKGKTFR